MDIHLIWAQDNDGGIGQNGKLPWNISEDLQNFKSITLNHTIVMGRKTWDSLPVKPLPNRRNIVLSKNNLKNIESYDSIEKCLKVLKNEHVDKIFIIGGRSIYKLFFYSAVYLHITNIKIINSNIDEFFPFNMDVIKKNFKIISSKVLNKNAIYTIWENLEINNY